jgi:predicted metal-dependent phosphoesterase TrpH
LIFTSIPSFLLIVFWSRAALSSWPSGNRLDGLAITDHDTMAGVEVFPRLAPDLIHFAGQEISTPHGDILGFF